MTVAVLGQADQEGPGAEPEGIKVATRVTRSH